MAFQFTPGQAQFQAPQPNWGKTIADLATSVGNRIPQRPQVQYRGPQPATQIQAQQAQPPMPQMPVGLQQQGAQPSMPAMPYGSAIAQAAQENMMRPGAQPGGGVNGFVGLGGAAGIPGIGGLLGMFRRGGL